MLQRILNAAIAGKLTNGKQIKYAIMYGASVNRIMTGKYKNG